MPKISSIKARQVYDSRGVPTVEVELLLASGAKGQFITPSGASVGLKEAVEIRDKDVKIFFHKGVEKALTNIRHLIAPEVLHRDFKNQEELDEVLILKDGTINKSRLGANAILPVSAAFFIASAAERKIPLYASGENQNSYYLPTPLINVINGGVHADNDLDIQEFMIVPFGAETFSESMRYAAEIFHALKSLLKARGLSISVGDEGGFAPQISSTAQALDLLTEAVLLAGFKLNVDVSFALDVAASNLYDYDSQSYLIDKQKLSSENFLNWYEKLKTAYPLCSIEDPFHEEDIQAFINLTAKMGQNLQIVGDDLFVTNEHMIKQGIKEQWANAVLVKPNQVGTISEALRAVKAAQNAGFMTIMSHRSGETEDTTIADLAVAFGCLQIKSGSMSRSERLAKYNRLLRIEEELGSMAKFAGKQALVTRVF